MAETPWRESLRESTNDCEIGASHPGSRQPARSGIPSRSGAIRMKCVFRMDFTTRTSQRGCDDETRGEGAQHPP